MSHHRVKTHHWIDGILSFIEKSFDTYEEAVKYAETTEHHNAKVFNEDNVVVHYIVKGLKQTSTYA